MAATFSSDAGGALIARARDREERRRRDWGISPTGPRRRWVRAIPAAGRAMPVGGGPTRRSAQLARDCGPRLRTSGDALDRASRLPDPVDGRHGARQVDLRDPDVDQD